METLKGIAALHKAEAVTKSGGDFTIAFYPFNRTKPAEGSIKLETYEHCTMRRPLPHEKWETDGKNYFLFSARDATPRICHRCLFRFMAFSSDHYQLHKITWYHE